MDTELSLAASFISSLLANKALDVLTPLQKEQQIMQFLKMNAQQLFPTLSSSRFFPGKQWTEIQIVLSKALMIETDKILLPQLEEFIRHILDFTFISFIQPQRVPAEKCQNTIIEFLKRLLQKPEARSAFEGPFTAVVMNFTDRYIDESFQLRQYIYFELTKFQRLKMSIQEIKNMIKATLLLKTGIHLLTVGGANKTQELLSATVKSQFADKVFTSLKGQLKILPPTLLKSAVNSNVSFQENK
ncbi:unnamed protein product, partial [marine sediment metagenome]